MYNHEFFSHLQNKILPSANLVHVMFRIEYNFFLQFSSSALGRPRLSHYILAYSNVSPVVLWYFCCNAIQFCWWKKYVTLLSYNTIVARRYKYVLLYFSWETIHIKDHSWQKYASMFHMLCINMFPNNTLEKLLVFIFYKISMYIFQAMKKMILWPHTFEPFRFTCTFIWIFIKYLNVM